MKKMTVISDTNNTVKDTCIDRLDSYDYIFHTGDICSIDMIDKLKKTVFLLAVKGKNDNS